MPSYDAVSLGSWGAITHASVALVRDGNNQFHCPKHPDKGTYEHITDVCKVCEQEFAAKTADLQQRRDSVQAAIQQLENSGGSGLSDLGHALKTWKTDTDDDEVSLQRPENMVTSTTTTTRNHPSISTAAAAANNSSSGINSITGNRTTTNTTGTNPSNPPPPPQQQQQHSMQQQRQQQHHYQPPQPPQQPQFQPPHFQAPHHPPPYPSAPPQPPSTTSTTTADALALQIQRMQQLQDWMLYQKEQECNELRKLNADAATEIQQLKVENALLTEKLHQQEQRMQQGTFE